MSNSNQFLLDRRNPIQVGDQFSAQQVRGVITLVPNQANATRQRANGTPPRDHRQELRMIVAAPAVERRVNAAAGMMDATLESWLANKMMPQILIACALILLLFLVAAATGLLIGAAIGQVVIPAGFLTLVLFGSVALAIFLLGLGLGAGLGG